MTAPVRTIRVLSCLLVTVMGLSTASACSSSSDTPAPTGSTSATASATGATSQVKFKSSLRSTYSKLNTVGAKKNQIYGVNIFEGTTTINHRLVRVRMLGTVDYQNGSGPLGGFLELVWSDGTVLGMSQDGQAMLDSATKQTALNAKLTVINGSDSAADTSGAGSLVGSRKTALGSNLDITVTLDLVNAPVLITGDSSSRESQTPSASYAATIAP